MCVCARVHAGVCVCVCDAWKWWRGQGKQDANESALINMCLISYSALSGHGKNGGAALGGVHEKVQAQPLIHSLS